MLCLKIKEVVPRKHKGREGVSKEQESQPARVTVNILHHGKAHGATRVTQTTEVALVTLSLCFFRSAARIILACNFHQRHRQ